MNLETEKQTSINNRLRLIHKKKYQLNAEQKKIFAHLIENGIQLDLKKPNESRILANGIPQIYRQKVWSQLIKNTHGITRNFYEILLKKVQKIIKFKQQQEKQIKLQQNNMPHLNLSKSKSEGYVSSEMNANNFQYEKIAKWIQIINQDIPRTFSQLKVFQKQPDAYSSLFNVLTAWTIFRQDIGYKQGMSQIAGQLYLQISNQLKVFQLFCSIMTRDVIYEFFTMNIEVINAFCQKIQHSLRIVNQSLYDHLKTCEVDYKMFILDWMYSLFTKCFQLDCIGKIWDLLFLNQFQQRFLVKVIIEIIQSVKDELNKFQTNQEAGHLIVRYLKKIKIDQIRQSQILQNLRNYER